MPSFRSLTMVRALALGTLLIFSVQLFILLMIWWQQAQSSGTFLLPLPARTAAIVELIDTAPVDERPTLLRALNTGNFHVRIEAEHPRSGQEKSIRLTAFKQAILRYSAELKGRRIDGMVGGLGRWFRGPVETENGLSANFPMRLNIELADGQWLVIETPSLADARLRRIPVGLFAGLFGMVLATLALLSIWQQFRPVRDMAESARSFAGDGKPRLVRPGGSQDIRDLVLAFNGLQEQVSALLANRTLVMSAMSHDVRTYLTRLRLRIEDLEPESRDAAEHTINDIQALLDDTLAFAESETGAPAPDIVDLRALFEDLIKAGQFEADRVTLLAEDDVRVAGHAGRLKRAFVNLITNAIKFGTEANISVLYKDGLATVEIADRGPGIPPMERSRVFQPFYRRDASRMRGIEGAGLGLAIAQSIIVRHGGNILLEDRAGGGLRVVVTLPAVR